MVNGIGPLQILRAVYGIEWISLKKIRVSSHDKIALRQNTTTDYCFICTPEQDTILPTSS